MGAAAAAPAAVEAERVTRQAGLDPQPSQVGVGSIHDGPGFDKDEVRAKLWKFLRKEGLPWWKKVELWEDAKDVKRLDADLASFKSFSMVAKVHHQQRRNYQQLLHKADMSIKFQEERSSFLSKWGLNWF